MDFKVGFVGFQENQLFFWICWIVGFQLFFRVVGFVGFQENQLFFGFVGLLDFQNQETNFFFADLDFLCLKIKNDSLRDVHCDCKFVIQNCWAVRAVFSRNKSSRSDKPDCKATCLISCLFFLRTSKLRLMFNSSLNTFLH